MALGPYPERGKDSPHGPVERLLERLAARTRGPAQASRHLRRAVADVEERGRALESRTDAELAALGDHLRRQLQREGLAEALALHVFALVREIAGRRLGMRHHGTQLMGGWVMLGGMLAEMETGEGKTLTATLPACAAALAGIPVHVITANDYLAARDAQQMRPVYEAFGLRVGAVVGTETDPNARRAAYACDVTYCTNKQVAFDYLRDRVLLGSTRGGPRLQLERLHRADARADRLLLRGLCFAIVDEADSVLIDEARTPLLLARACDASEEHRTHAQALELASRLQPDAHYRILARDGRIELTEPGREQLAKLAESLEGPWSGSRRREAWVVQALHAQHLLVRDQHYLVRDDAIVIVDTNTGRTMPDRSWERGLHQMVELKEGCAPSAGRETLARISTQRFFQRYLRLAGMTGTAREVAAELWSVYGLRTVPIPTHRPLRRRRLGTRVHPDATSRWTAVVERARMLHRQGRPVLIGTRSVAASDELSERLRAAGLPHQVLSARHDRDEALVVARAGESGRITVATNMAGRGTDIRLAAGVAEHGGLHVIAAEPNEARRIDRQLFGRCGRQGDPGSFEAIAALDDELVRVHCPAAVRGLARYALRLGGLLTRWSGRGAVALAQRAAERQHARMRRDVLRADEHMDRLLAFTGPRE